MAAGVALRETRFWLLTVGFAASGFATLSLTVHLPYLVVSGHTSSFAATVAGLFRLMSLIGRLTIGPLADRYPRRWMTAGLIGMQIAGLVVLATSGRSAAGALLYVALFGAGSGTLTILRTALLAEQYGPTNYGTTNGAQIGALTASGTPAPVGVGLLIGLAGGYPALLWTLVALLVLGASAVLLAREPIGTLVDTAA